MHKAILYSLATLALAGVCSSTVISFPPTDKALQGVWIGVPYQANDFCRLVLTNNTGLFAHGFEDEKPMLYTINSYKTEGQGHVTFNVSPISTNAYPIVVIGTANSHQIRLVIKSPDGGWSHESMLYREETVNKMLEGLKKVMENGANL
jgi:hypothetical protein